MIQPIDRLQRKKLVSEEHAQQLQLVREIRNVFAHNLWAGSFVSPEIAELLKGISGPPREAFQSLFNTCASALYGLLHAKYQERRKAYWAEKMPRLQPLKYLRESTPARYTPRFNRQTRME